MKIAVLGAGRMGSALAWYLAKAGHAVTVVARGERLARLQRDGGIENVSGEAVALAVAGELDPAAAVASPGARRAATRRRGRRGRPSS